MSKYRVRIYKEIGYSFDVEVETKHENADYVTVGHIEKIED